MSEKKEGETIDDLDASTKPLYGEDLGTKNVSKLLVEARQSLNLSQKEIADQLYLTKTLIQQLEEGKFGELPTKAFVKGYLRSYARAVGLSGDILVQRFEDEEKEKTGVSEPTLPISKGSKLASLSITGPVAKTAAIGISGFFLAVVSVWLLVRGPNNPGEVTSSLNIANKEEVEIGEINRGMLEEDRSLVLGELDLDPQKVEVPVLEKEEIEKNDLQKENLEEQNLEEQNPEEQNLEEQNLEEANFEEPGLEKISEKERTVQSAGEESSIPEENESATKISERVNFERIVSDGKSSIFVTTEGSDELKMIFRGECWAEVDEENLGRIYNDLNVDGDELTIRGQGPFRVLLGKARSVDIIYNGKSVDLEPYIARDQTAKIRLTD